MVLFWVGSKVGVISLGVTRQPEGWEMIAVSSFLFGAMSGWLYLGSYKSSFYTVVATPKKLHPLKFFLLTMLRIWIFLPFFLLLSLLFKMQITTVLCGASLAMAYAVFMEIQ